MVIKMEWKRKNIYDFLLSLDSQKIRDEIHESMCILNGIWLG